jgi:hypothetical protein
MVIPNADAQQHERVQPVGRAGSGRSHDVVTQSQRHRNLELQDAVNQPDETED